jgi:sugar phosphate isomerase/epimerase
MKISIISYAFHGLQKAGKMDLFGYLETVRYRYGLAAADIWNGTLVGTDEEYLKKVKEALAEREMPLVCLAVDGAHTWDPDPVVREKNRQVALAHLRAAVYLGAETVRIDVGGRAPEMSTEQFDWAVARYREYARIAADHGFRVGPENHYGPALVPENMQRIHDAVADPAFGVLLHFGHWTEGRETEGDRMAAPWAFHTHCPWYRIDTLEADMQIVRDAGYQGYWGVEHYSGQNEHGEVAIHIAKVRDVLTRWRLG